MDIRVKLLRSPIYGGFTWGDALLTAVIIGGFLFLGLVS